MIAQAAAKIGLTILATLSTFETVSAAVTAEGCFADDGSLTSLGTYQYQSNGYCQTQCSAAGYAVFANSNGNECSCGNALPPTTASANSCNVACVGYPDNLCGGSGYYTVFLTGTGTLSGASGSSASTGGRSGTTTATTPATTATTSSSTTAAAAPSVIYITSVVQQGVTIVQTVSASTQAAARNTAATASASSSSRASAGAQTGSSDGGGGGGGISGGAIAGIVIGVLALIALGAIGLFIFMRRRRRDSEDFGGEYKRQIEPAGAGVTRNPSSVDNRLDTSLAIRRNSAESLADNQDYSRKILRVVN